MGNHSAARVLRPTPVVFLATPPQETPEVAAGALIIPDHPVNPFVAEGYSAFSPQLAGNGATNTARQLARLMPDLLLSGLRPALGLLKAIPPLPRVPGKLPANRPLAKPQCPADLDLCLACLPQGVHLTSIFVRDPTIRPHS